METIAQLVGVSPHQLMQLLILIVVLVIGWFLLRLFLKLTAAVFRLGCMGIILIAAAVYVVQLLGQ